MEEKMKYFGILPFYSIKRITGQNGIFNRPRAILYSLYRFINVIE